jgi:hypothetical protein
MRLRNSFFFNIAIVGASVTLAAMLAIPGEAKQPDATSVKVAPQATFGLLLDPHVEPVLIIELARNFRAR